MEGYRDRGEGKERRKHVPIYVIGAEVERVESIKFLRVVITGNLSWTSHIDAMVKKTPDIIDIIIESVDAGQHGNHLADRKFSHAVINLPANAVQLVFLRPNQSLSTNTLIRLVELVLTLNNFSFDSSHFLKTEGVAMGTHMGLSCLFVGFMEQSLFHNYTGSSPHLILHYTDDCIGAALCSHEELEQFMNFANTLHHALKFTWTISDTSFPFLDLSVSIS
eukprot:g46269.t1